MTFEDDACSEKQYKFVDFDEKCYEGQVKPLCEAAT